MAAPRAALIRTAIAAEISPSPDSSFTMPTGRFLSLTYTASGMLRMHNSFGSRCGEEAERLDERDGHEEHAGDERGDGDRPPHLLASSFDGLDERSVKVA